ncbi:quercetin 2,3-dioxygenase [Bdellovibrio bacteriovorus]|uniref:Quercetin 2,3-dioxygenase n=1 Tax=Bdellovibrio bacteriovorus TaxID=959 RepID=A0A150WU42_BDEBC|nr:pirin family protein [Bdellovibrio bacteriovorus]KYG69963.1 quercetin 2,3-dioxygenase [Bdellovibrio bacteriovorus]
MKKLLFSQTTEQRHWVGDGFPVRSIFSYNDRAKEMSPFLLMDYAGPAVFPAATQKERRGVGEHPHRGFETVTIVYEGQVEHRDSAGGGGIIGPGDVQWMTAASGLVHEEFHGPDFAKQGGRFEMVQLWVNLPRAYKMSSPRYQGIISKNIPSVELADGAGVARIIAGNFDGHKGPAMTFTSINLWDLRLKAGHTTEFKVPAGHTASVFVLSGKVRLGTGEVLQEASLAALDPVGDVFSLAVESDAKVLFMGGEAIHEPVVGYGPFVMNSKAEIMQAITDYQLGRMGQLAQEVVR